MHLVLGLVYTLLVGVLALLLDMNQFLYPIVMIGLRTFGPKSSSENSPIVGKYRI